MDVHNIPKKSWINFSNSVCIIDLDNIKLETMTFNRASDQKWLANITLHTYPNYCMFSFYKSHFVMDKNNSLIVFI